MADNPEMKAKYVGFTPRNYNLALFHDAEGLRTYGAFTLLDPFSMFFGRFRVLTKENLEKILADSLKAEHTGFAPVFDQGKEIYLKVNEKGKWVSRRRKFHDLTPSQAWRVIERWTKARYGNCNLTREGATPDEYDKIFRGVDIAPYQGEITLHGNVRNKRGRHAFNIVEIQGPLTDSNPPLSSIICHGDEEARYNRNKYGRDCTGYLCPEAGALLVFSHYMRKLVENLGEVSGRRGADIWLPFHPKQNPNIFLDDVVTMVQGEKPKMDSLMIDAMVAYLSETETKTTINDKLFKIPAVWDQRLREFFEQGYARMVVVHNEWIFDRSREIPPETRTSYDRAHERLTSGGYNFAGLTFEKKDAQFEMVAMEYQKGNSVIRLLFFGDLPPLEQENKIIPEKGVDIFAMEKRGRKAAEPKHPYAELYQPKIRWDDSRRIYVASETRLLSSWTPEDLVPDYHAAIEFFVPGGNKELRGRIGGARKSMIGKTGWDLGRGLTHSFAYHVTNYKA